MCGFLFFLFDLVRKVSESVIPFNPLSPDDIQLSRTAVMPRSKSAECSLDDGGGHVTRRPTTPVTYTNLLNWRQGKPEVYVINDAVDSAPGHVTSDVTRSSSGSKKSSRHGGKMATSDETLTSFDHSSASAVGEMESIFYELVWFVLRYVSK